MAAWLPWPHQILALVAVACLLDRLVGDPLAWLHPVQVMGWVIERLRRPAEAWAGDQPARLRLMGLVITMVLVLGSALAGWSLERLAGLWPLVGLPLLLIGMASALAGRSLEQAVRGVLRALRRVRVPVRGVMTSPAGWLGPEARRARCPSRRLGRARLLHAGGASLIHVQLLRLPTLQYSSPRAGQPIKVARPAHKTTVDTEI
jgi:hypothetical protein